MKELGEDPSKFTIEKCSGGAECKKALTLLKMDRLQADFVEGMACEEMCIRDRVYMGTAIIIVVLVIIVIFAVKSGIKHGKGEGGCCGSGGTMKEDKKVLAGDIIATKLVTIEGMHCDNCKNSIEHQINRIDGAACAVNLKKKTDAIQLDKPVDDDLIRRTIERCV